MKAHIEREYKRELNSEGVEKDGIIRSLKKVNRTVCSNCNKVRDLSNDKSVCLKCVSKIMNSSWKGMIHNSYEGNIVDLVKEIHKADRTEIDILKHTLTAQIMMTLFWVKITPAKVSNFFSSESS